jgi:hypothetical protein
MVCRKEFNDEPPQKSQMEQSGFGLDSGPDFVANPGRLRQ